MAKRKNPTAPIEQLAMTGGRAEAYQSQADTMQPATPVERATQKWMSGMAAHFRRRFAERLQEQREKAGLTRNALAVKAGVSPILVTRIETGERSCTFQTAVQLAGALGVELGLLAPDPSPAEYNHIVCAMTDIQVIQAIKDRFGQTGSPTDVPLLRGGSFSAKLLHDGIEVDNLGNEPHLQWQVFQEAVNVLIRNGGRAKRGIAMGNKLGDPDLSLDSVEGHVAQVVYHKRQGDTIFRRVTPIACILIWAGICQSAPKELVLRPKAL